LSLFFVAVESFAFANSPLSIASFKAFLCSLVTVTFGISYGFASEYVLVLFEVIDAAAVALLISLPLYIIFTVNKC
jgi:hypothetical protein